MPNLSLPPCSCRSRHAFLGTFLKPTAHRYSAHLTRCPHTGVDRHRESAMLHENRLRAGYIVQQRSADLGRKGTPNPLWRVHTESHSELQVHHPSLRMCDASHAASHHSSKQARARRASKHYASAALRSSRLESTRSYVGMRWWVSLGEGSSWGGVRGFDGGDAAPRPPGGPACRGYDHQRKSGLECSL